MECAKTWPELKSPIWLNKIPNDRPTGSVIYSRATQDADKHGLRNVDNEIPKGNCGWSEPSLVLGIVLWLPLSLVPAVRVIPKFSITQAILPRSC